MLCKLSLYIISESLVQFLVDVVSEKFIISPDFLIKILIRYSHHKISRVIK